MAALSVIVPTLNAATRLPGCAAALMEGVQQGLIRDLVVSDGGSTDATVEVAEELGATIVAGPASRGAQVARGVAAGRGDWLLILHADTQPAPGWTDAVARHMRDAPDRAGFFDLGFDRGGAPARAVAAWANLRARRLGLPFGDQGLLIRRAVLAAAGGYPDLPLMEDVALARALRGRLSPLGHRAVTSADRYLAEGWARRGARNLSLQLRFMAGTDPERLAAAYARRR